MNIEPLKIGKRVSLSRAVTEEDIESFAKLSLDRNPVHFDEEFASRTIFGRRIAHGGIGDALVSGAPTRLMGDGNIWLSASMKFEEPIHIGDQLHCALTVSDIDRRRVASIDVEIANSRGEIVISGSIQSMRFVSRK